MQRPNTVIVHPLVLLSVVDHYNRVVQKNKNRRVVGVLLGEWNKGNLDITNCYAIPFEEDVREQHIWFVDHIYHETMYGMFRKINAREKVVGWYTTGTRFKPHDIEINELFRKYCNNPVLVVIDVEQSDALSLPTEAYQAVEEISKSGEIIKNFIHLPSTVEAFEPEEIGVEHLLREIKDISLNSLSNQVQQKLTSLKGLIGKIEQIGVQLDRVSKKEIAPNNQIIYHLQEILNLLPNIGSDEMMKAFQTKNNDLIFVLYVCSLTRSIISLHTLINNKLQNRETEKKQDQPQTSEKPKEAKNDKGEKGEKTEKSDKKP